VRRALILDCDGVIAETERDLHLPAFNQAFAEAGLDLHWSDDEYAGLLQVAGGKERMAASLPEDERGLVGSLHARKAQLLEAALAENGLQPRPGIVRLVREARDAGWALAVASTSSERSVRVVAAAALGAELAGSLQIFAGDVVPAKKPDPAIYELAVARLGVAREEAIVVEDSHNGLLAATGAGLACVITVSTYTGGEDFTGAAMVLPDLGSVTLADLDRLLSGP
jgi:HAD superfamily hydrolase (TIGR01509 family)